MEKQNSQLPKVTLDDIAKMNKENIKIKPKDAIHDGIIIDMEIKSWAEHLKDRPEALAKFAEPKKEMIFITYEAAGFKGIEPYTPMSEPTENSKLGKHIIKYNKAPVIGDKIKVKFNGQGYSEIIRD